jgi:hypothetical protein
MTEHRRRGTNLDDLLVQNPRQKDVLLILIRIELHHIRYLPITEPVDTSLRLRVPRLHMPVVPTREELFVIVGEDGVVDCCDVSVEGTEAVVVEAGVPKLNTSCMSAVT